MISPLGSRYGIGGALGRSVKRASGGGWWDLNGTITSCVAAYQPKGAASYAAAKVNLANPGTYNATAVNGDVGWNTSDGFISSYSNNYKLNTGVTVNSANWTYIIRYSNYVANIKNENICGYWNSRKITAFRLNAIGGVKKGNFANYSYDSYHATIDTDGSLTSAVVGAAGETAYLNGSSVGTITQSTSQDGVFYICGRNYSDNSPSVYTIAFAIYNSVLTSTQISDLSTAMAAL